MEEGICARRARQVLNILGKKLQPVRITQDHKRSDEQARAITLKRVQKAFKSHSNSL